MSRKKPELLFISIFEPIPDHRFQPNCDYRLPDLIAMALVAVISNCEGWDEIAEFVDLRRSWFRSFMKIPPTSPCVDTFRRVFSHLDPQELNQALVKWTESLRTNAGVELVHIDGKTLRRSFNRASKATALHVFTAWSSTNQLVLGQTAVDSKENETSALPKILELLSLPKCVVTIDAVGTTPEIAAHIRRKKADYLLAVELNQPHQFEDLQDFFSFAEEASFEDLPHQAFRETTKDHGRVEVREYLAVEDLSGIRDHARWKDLSSLVLVKATRKVDGKETTEPRYFISSCRAEAKALGQAIRSPWEGESLHHILDVTFDEDGSRIRTGKGPENFALLRRWAISILQRSNDGKTSIRRQRKRASWEPEKSLGCLFA